MTKERTSNLGTNETRRHVTYRSVTEEMAEYDALPAEVRRALAEAPVKLSTAGLLDAWHECGRNTRGLAKALHDLAQEISRDA